MWRKARQIIESGALGNLIRTCMIEPHFRTQAYYDSGDWRATWIGEGGGVMMNQAPHSLDCFVWLGGMPKTVYGRCDTRAHRIEVEDVATALLGYPNGATGYIYTSTYEYPASSLFQFVGDRAVLEVRDGQLRVGTSAPGAGEFIRTTPEAWAVPVEAWSDISTPPQPYGPPHRHITENFVAAVLDGTPLLAPGEEAIRSLELANAITVSSDQGKEVKIPLARKSFDDVLRKYIAGSRGKSGQSGKKVVLPWI
jgi:predicted dehydrogenase